MSTPVQELDFTEDWFSDHIPVWTQLMASLPERKRFLELGSFEGRASCWMLENGLAPDGSLTCVDSWSGSPEFATIPKEHVDGAYDRFIANTEAVRGPAQIVEVMRMTTVAGLAMLIADLEPGMREAPFDFIYVDAGHRAAETLTDMVFSWPLLKPGGIMVCDDYVWSWGAPLECRPKLGIDAFLSCWHRQYSPLVIGPQVAIQKL